MNPDNGGENHYARGAILPAILRALEEMGKDLSRLVPADLAPVDAFHLCGGAATIELASRATLQPGLRLLDVSSGLGCSVRYLADTHRVRSMPVSGR